MLLSKVDEFGKAGWITLVVLSFWLAWPVGLMLIAFLAGSGRLRLWRHEACAGRGWSNLRTGFASEPGRGRWRGGRCRSSGNKAFDDYRDETLRTLEEEEREFQAFLERLRQARDKAEFDAFMAERRNRSAGPGPESV